MQRDLALNPRIIGTMADETGCIAGGKLVWSEHAWKQLFFPEPKGASSSPGASSDYDADDFFPRHSWEELTALDPGSLRSIEEGFAYARITMTFGWSSTVGRLCVLGVEW